MLPVARRRRAAGRASRTGDGAPRWPRPRTARGRGGAPAGRRRRDLRPLRVRAEAPPSGSAPPRRRRRALVRPARHRGRAGAVARRGRPDPERQDDEPGRARHPGLGGPGGGGQREERPPAPHARRPGRAGAGCGASIRPAARARRPSDVVPARRLRRVASGPPGGGRPVRGGQGRRHDRRRRVLVRHRGQAAGPAPLRRGARRAAPWPTWCAGSTPRRSARWPTSWRRPGARGARGGARHVVPRRADAQLGRTRRPRRCWRRSRHPPPAAAPPHDAVRPAAPPRRVATRCTCARPPTTSAGCAATSPR